MEYFYCEEASAFLLSDMETGEIVGEFEDEGYPASVAVLNYARDSRTSPLTLDGDWN